MRRTGYLRATRLLVVGVALLAAGCFGATRHMIAPPSPVVAGIAPGDIADVAAEADSLQLVDPATLFRVAEQIRTEHRPVNPPPKRSVLALSGGGAYGAFSAGRDGPGAEPAPGRFHSVVAPGRSVGRPAMSRGMERRMPTDPSPVTSWPFETKLLP